MSKKDNKICQICNKKAVGFHYGAYVCEACKKFFVRHASGVCRLYGSCQDKGKCDLNIDGRGKCQHCRFKRCTDIGMNIDSKSSDYDLTAIPCEVCGSKSSGLHFGCITCEGCKGFFRRMVKFSGGLVCFNDNNCKLDLKNRSTCKSCRMKRCLSVGMSRKGIRIGRHTNSLKFTCLSKHKAHKPPDIIIVDSLSDNEADLSSKSETIDNSCKSDVEMTICKVEDEDQNDNCDETIIDNVEKTNDKDPTPLSNPISDTGENCIYVSECVTNGDQSTQSNFSSPKSELQMKEELEEIEDINELLIDNNLTIASIFLKQYKLENGKDNIINSLLSSTDSLQTVWSLMMDHFVFHSQFIVKFAKLMPGFLHLSLQDKKTVIKDAMYPMILLELSQDYRETDEEVYYNYFDFSAADRQIILGYFPEFTQFSIQVRNTGAMKCSIGLDSLEVAILCGIIMYYNYLSLENWMFGKSMVLHYQENLNHYFRYHLKLSEVEIKIRQSKIMEFIVVLNEMNINHHNIITDFCAEHKELQYPDLYIEMFKY